MRRLVALLCLLWTGGTPAAAGELNRAETGALPGDPAVPLVTSKWIRGEPVARFEPGHAYVVDLWASWCAPCLASMPHLRRLQDRYRGDLTAIAMNVWELKPEKVPSVVASLGDSMVTAVAMDSVPAGKEANEGITATAYNGRLDFISIPRTILIDRRGRIAWIGTPRELDEPLARVIDGTWNPEPFAAGYVAAIERDLEFSRALQRVESAIERQDWEGAYRVCEATASADSSFVSRMANPGFERIAMEILRLQNPPAAATALARRAAERALQLRPDATWVMFRVAADAARASGDREAARAYLQRALALAPEKERPKLAAAIEELTSTR